MRGGGGRHDGSIADARNNENRRYVSIPRHETSVCHMGCEKMTCKNVANWVWNANMQAIEICPSPSGSPILPDSLTRLGGLISEATTMRPSEGGYVTFESQV